QTNRGAYSRTKSATRVVLPAPALAVTSVTARERLAASRSIRRGLGNNAGAGRGGANFVRRKNAGWSVIASPGGRDDTGRATSGRCRLSIISRSLSVWIRARGARYTEQFPIHSIDYFEGFTSREDTGVGAATVISLILTSASNRAKPSPKCGVQASEMWGSSARNVGSKRQMHFTSFI